MQLPVEGLECHPDQPICTTPSPKRLTVLGGPGERGPDIAFGGSGERGLFFRLGLVCVLQWEDSSTLRFKL